MRKQRLPHWQISEPCNRALYGWPYGVEPYPGYIESDAEPGSFYPCATCNPDWSRVEAPRARVPSGGET